MGYSPWGHKESDTTEPLHLHHIVGTMPGRISLVCCCLVTKLCLTLCDPMDCSPSGSSVHGISQARILEWVAISFSRDLANPGRKPCLLHFRRILYC